MTRYITRAIISFSIASILLGGCGYTQASDNQGISKEDIPKTGNGETGRKEESIDITEESWKDGYTIVLNAYKEEADKIIENGIYWDSYDEIPELPNVDDSKIEMEFYIQSGPFAFMLKDIDDNEIPELFICRGEHNSGVIYHIFTWSEGETIELLSGLGYRNGICSICQDNLLRVESSGTATDYDNTIYYLPENGIELKVVEQFYATQSEDDATKSDFFWLSSDGTKTHITEDKYIEYTQKYVEQEGLKYIEGTQENLDHIADIWGE